jgi:hypothetical protein
MLAQGPADEETLGEVLRFISAAAGDDLGPMSGDAVPEEHEAWSMLAAVDAWASLASFAFQRVYGEELPAVGTPFVRFPGAKKDVERWLRDVASRFRPVLAKVCPVLGAFAYSISVGFPLGVSVGVTWQP